MSHSPRISVLLFKMPKTRKHSLLVLFILFLGNNAPALNLHKTLQYALLNSPELSSEKLKLKVAEGENKAKLGSMLPQLDITAQSGAGFNRPTPGASEPWTSQLSLNLKENLYDNGESYTRYKQAQSELELEKLQLKRQTQKLFLDIIQNFHEYSKLKQILAARTEQRLLYQKQNQLSTKQYKGGLKTKKDFLRFKAQAQRATLEERSAENQLKKIKLLLYRLMGIKDEILSEFKALEVKDLQTEMPQTPWPIELSLDSKIIEATRELKSYEVTLAQRNNLPKLSLSLSGQYGYNPFINSNSPLDSRKNYGAQALFTLSYNLLDWGIRKHEVDKALQQELIAGHDAHKSKLELKTEIESLQLDLSDLKANQVLTEELLANQQKSYELLFHEYQEGQVQYVDLNNSLQELMESKLLYLNAHYQLSSALTKHDYYLGKLHDRYLQK